MKISNKTVVGFIIISMKNKMKQVIRNLCVEIVNNK